MLFCVQCHTHIRRDAKVARVNIGTQTHTPFCSKPCTEEFLKGVLITIKSMKATETSTYNIREDDTVEVRYTIGTMEEDL